MSIFINSKKMETLFIGGKEINKAYQNGKLLFAKTSTGISSYGTLTYLDNNSIERNEEIILDSDWDTLFLGESNPVINFSFGEVVAFNKLTGFSFNLDPLLSKVPNIIPNNFLIQCMAFNCDLIIPNNVTSIGSAFLFECQNFNGNITFNNLLDGIGGHFLYGCENFNKYLDLKNIKNIGYGFLGGCSTFNQNILIPIDCNLSNFNPSGFNSILTLSTGVKATYQILGLQSGTLSNITIVCDTDPINLLDLKDPKFPNKIDSFTFATEGTSTMKVTGTYASALMTKFPNTPLRRLTL